MDLTVERVAQVDLVPEGVAQLDANELAVPRPLHVLFAVTVGVRVRLEGELSPDGILSCRDRKPSLHWPFVHWWHHDAVLSVLPETFSLTLGSANERKIQTVQS